MVRYVCGGGVPMVQRRRQWRDDRVPAVRGTVPVRNVGRWRRRRRGRPEPGGRRRRRRFVVIAVTVAQVMTGTLLVTVTAAGVLLFVVTTEIRGVVIVKIRAARAGRHDVDRGRRQRRRYPAVRAVYRAQRTRPMLGRWCPLSRRGDGRGGGGGAPRLVVVNVLVELHGGGGGGGTRSTDGNGRLRLRTEAAASRDPLVRLFVRSLAAAAVSVSSGRGTVQTLAARKRIGQKCCFFHQTADPPPPLALSSVRPPARQTTLHHRPLHPRPITQPPIRHHPPPTESFDERESRSSPVCSPMAKRSRRPWLLGKSLHPRADPALIRRASWTKPGSFYIMMTET